MNSAARKCIFDAVRKLRGGQAFTADEVRQLDAAIDDATEVRAAPRRIGPKALKLIMDSEGLRLTSYKCPADVWTIGYGSTGPHVKPGMTITEAEAQRLLFEDLDRFERGVENMAGEMTPAQFGAMVGLAFNIGLGAFGSSTLLKRHLAGDHAGTANEFAKWTKGGGRVLPGLVTRRMREAALYRGAA